MQIPIEDVTTGKLKDSIVWICDYRWPDLRTTNPLRNVSPVEVLVQDNSQSSKNIYYSDCHFVVLKNGKPTKKIHAPYDNTGYRSFKGNPVQVFDNYEECATKYATLLSEMIPKWESYKRAAIAECDSRVADCNTAIEKFLK